MVEKTDRELWDDIIKEFYKIEREAQINYRRPPIFDVWLVVNYEPPKKRDIPLT